MDMRSANRAPWTIGSTFFLCVIYQTHKYMAYTSLAHTQCAITTWLSNADNAIGFQHCKISMGLE